MLKLFKKNEVFEGDDFPSHICRICLEKIELYYEFRLKIEKCDTILRNEKNLSLQNSRSEMKMDQSCVQEVDYKKLTLEKASSKTLLENTHGSELREVQFPTEENHSIDSHLKTGQHSGIQQQLSHTSQNEIFAMHNPVISQCSNNLSVDQAGNEIKSQCLSKTSIVFNGESHYNSSDSTMKHPTPKSLKKLQNKWPCDMCGKLYASKNIMQTHKTTVHSNMRPFPCQFCEKAFKTKGQKGTHEQLHLAKLHSVFGNKESPPEVSTETINFERSSGTKNALYKCEVCGKSYVNKYTLHKHRKLHTDESLFSCKYCLRTFKACELKDDHEKMHIEQSDVKVSEKVNSEPSGLFSNLFGHTRNKFQCRYCLEELTYSHMFTHMKQKHSEMMHQISYEVQNRGYYSVLC